MTARRGLRTSAPWAKAGHGRGGASPRAARAPSTLRQATAPRQTIARGRRRESSPWRYGEQRSS